MSLLRRRFVCDSGSLNTLSFPGSDVSLGDEIWLVVKSSINVGQQMSLLRRHFVCDSGSLYTLSFPGSDVSLGDEIWLVVKSSINVGQQASHFDSFADSLGVIGGGIGVRRPPSSPKAAAAAASLGRKLFRPILTRRIRPCRSRQADLVQADEGILSPVVDLIDVVYRNLPSDVSLGDEIWLVVKSSIAGQQVIVSVRSIVAFRSDLLTCPDVSATSFS
ncbi:TMV resistance protein N-like [Dorcoceras hygrometricum]|uniref:TMV resistance protein N-like n=1 Tax=Dorcoceras hygrometricum TaxID=472368 RepID=A0A2Z7AV96_9LAMI|nr:TMV resistance protein N-like [Dorcoceras hygrometricum]